MAGRTNDRYGNRSDEEAAKNLAERTHRENLMKPVWVAQLQAMGKLNVRIEDHGIANSGEYISDKEIDKAELLKPDWMVHHDDTSYRLEVMTHSLVYTVCSFKKLKLARAAREGYPIAVMRDTFTDILAPETCKYLLDNFPIIDLVGMGDWPGVRLSNEQLVDLWYGKGLIKRVIWKPEAREELDKVFAEVFPKTIEEREKKAKLKRDNKVSLV